jgi:hypothetical protein
MHALPDDEPSPWDVRDGTLSFVEIRKAGVGWFRGISHLVFYVKGCRRIGSLFFFWLEGGSVNERDHGDEKQFWHRKRRPRYSVAFVTA